MMRIWIISIWVADIKHMNESTVLLRPTEEGDLLEEAGDVGARGSRKPSTQPRRPKAKATTVERIF